MPSFFGFYTSITKRRFWRTATVSVLLLALAALGVEAAAKLHPVYQIKTAEKVAALTFDISWGDNTPGPVLDILQQEKIPATFFLSGPWVRDFPDIPCRIRDDGHELASHGNRHIDYSNLSRDEICREIMKAHQSILDVTGVTTRLIRLPNGDYNNTVIQAARDCGYQAIQWSVDSLDWMNPGVENIVTRVREKLHPGAIILMHASDTCKETAEALPQVLAELKSQGYRLVTVSQLLEIGPGEP